MVSEKDSGSPSRENRSRSRTPEAEDTNKEEEEVKQRRSTSPPVENGDSSTKQAEAASTDEVKNETSENNEDNNSESNKVKARSTSRSKSRSKSRSTSRSRSRTKSRSRDRSRHRNTRREKHRRRRSRSRSYSRSRSPRRSRSRSRTHHRRRRDSRDRRRYKSRSYSRSRSPSPYYRRLNPSPCRVIGIFGLSFQTDERDLKRVFEKYGRIDKVKLVTDPRTGRSRGFAFIYMDSVEDAEEAKERVHGTEIDGNHVRCEFSISNREHNPTPGVYMGRRTARYDERDDYYRRGANHYSRSRSRSRSYERRRRSYSNDRY